MKTGGKRICKWCGKPFSAGYVSRKYCSDECSKKACNAKKAEHRREKTERMRKAGQLTRICEVCGEKFESVRSDRRFCSPKCARAARRKDPQSGFGEAKCAICGKVYMRKSSNQLYCSPECSKAGRAKVSKESKQRKKALDRPLMRDSLQDVAVMAARAGMSYGRYVARMGL